MEYRSTGVQLEFGLVHLKLEGPNAIIDEPYLHISCGAGGGQAV